MGYRRHFSRFLDARPGRLHFAAHSHHPWPDVSFEAHQRSWLDAAEYIDDKWQRVFGVVIPAAQAHIARLLQLPDPRTLAFAPNTHELLLRLLSSIDARPSGPPIRVLSTDSEFLSFSRQLARMEEAGIARVTRIAVEPYADFSSRFAQACAAGEHDLVWFSQCFFNSGYRIQDLAALVRSVPDRQTLVVIDGYHGFMAAPTDLSTIADRVFYLAGGYKYAMAGEGACFLHAPPGYALRPVNTGWYAGFAALADGGDATVAYATDGGRFWGSTFDPSGLYRLVAVMDWCQQLGLTPERIHRHVQTLQAQFLLGLAQSSSILKSAELLPPHALARGNFLCFRTPAAATLQQALSQRDVMLDCRGNRLRIGFGIYHEAHDVRELLRRLP